MTRAAWALGAWLLMAACASQPPPKIAAADKPEAVAPDAQVPIAQEPTVQQPLVQNHTEPEPNPSTQAPPSAPRHIPTREELAAIKANHCSELLTRMRLEGLKVVSITMRLRARGTYRDGDVPRFEALLRRSVPAGSYDSLQLINAGLPTWALAVYEPALKWICKTDAIQSLDENRSENLFQR